MKRVLIPAWGEQVFEMHDLIPQHLELVDAKLLSRSSRRNVIFNCLQRLNHMLSSGKMLILWRKTSYKKIQLVFYMVTVSMNKRHFYLRIYLIKQSHYRLGEVLWVPGGWGSQISRQSAHEGGKVVSPTHRPPLPTGSIPGTHFSYRLSRPQGHSAAGRIMSMKNSSDNIGNRTRDLPTCSAVPQPTALRRASEFI